MDIEKKVEAVAEKVEERSLAMEILSELKLTIKRLWVIILILIGVLVGSNMAWLYVFQSYDYVSYEQSTEGGGDANFIGNDGDINNGTSESQDAQEAQK